MHTVEVYFGFHRRATLRELAAGASIYQAFGHVEAWGYTVDQTWWFFNPNRYRARLEITHRHDEVEYLMAEKFTLCDQVFRYAGEPANFGRPLHGPMNCVTQCAALIGVRAFTPWGFRKKLRAMNAEVIHGKTPGKRGRSQGQDAGTPHVDAGAA